MKPLSWRAAAVLIALALPGAPRAAPIPPPPPTPAGAVTDVIQGAQVADPYRWLEDASDPKVDAWSDAQNQRTRAYLDALPGRPAVMGRLKTFITATSPAFAQIEARGERVFALYNDPKFQQTMLVTLDAKADPRSRKALLDPNVMDPKGLTALDWYVPSTDGSMVAVSLSKNGSEDGTLHVYDAATGQEIGQPIPRVQYPTAGGALAWTADGKGFWYTRYPGPDAPEAEQHFNMQVWFHRLGADPKDDVLALGTRDGLERVSEVFLDNRFGKPDVMAMVQRGDGNVWAFYVLSQDAPPVRVGTYGDGIVYATIGPDGAIYAISRKGTSNGKVLKLKAPFAEGALASAPELVPSGDVAIVSGGAEQQTPDLDFSRTRLFVRDIIGGPNDVRVFDLDGKPLGHLPLPPIASNDEIEALKDGQVLFDVSTYLRPRYFASWDPASGRTRETGLKVTSPISFADAKVTRLFAVSRDGTKVPVNVIARKDIRLDGSHPLLLYGYGGYGINMSPGFLGAFRRLWLDAGGVYAVANIRGGGEYGERWHQEGMLTRKQNGFDDFAAAARTLIGRRYTSHARLALMGGSNGGLLMGAEITQHPDLAHAVVSAVGVYDMVRSETDPNGAFNTTEYGTVKDPGQFKALFAYSPYHHVTKGAAYPAVLMLTGANDGRVNPMHSRKFTAALQAATSSSRPILLRTSKTSGHGIGSSLDERIGEQADELTFLYDQLGMKAPAGPARTAARKGR